MFRKKISIIMKRICCAGLCAGLVFTQPGIVSATEVTPTAIPTPEHSTYYSQAADTDSVKGWPKGPSIEGQSAVLMDVVTESVLYSKDADEKLYPASITKIMTCLLACENLDMNDTITMSQEAAYGIEAGSSSIYAETDEVFTVEQALMALMLESANEMALAIGEKVSGSVKKFVELMNQRAAQLGCKNTHFNNPNGLPDETH
ncbi:MAG: D-alanyl-D-alanine carboxypeptidase, partial [Blautia sp.]|nr:D-alanyl-D-alanine carboxypeptidase [Blautia sp.]